MQFILPVYGYKLGEALASPQLASAYEGTRSCPPLVCVYVHSWTNEKRSQKYEPRTRKIEKSVSWRSHNDTVEVYLESHVYKVCCLCGVMRQFELHRKKLYYVCVPVHICTFAIHFSMTVHVYHTQEGLGANVCFTLPTLQKTHTSPSWMLLICARACKCEVYLAFLFAVLSVCACREDGGIPFLLVSWSRCCSRIQWCLGMHADRFLFEPDVR